MLGQQITGFRWYEQAILKRKTLKQPTSNYHIRSSHCRSAPYSYIFHTRSSS